jgi:hypothetical protein
MYSSEMFHSQNPSMHHALLNQILTALDNDPGSTIYELFLQTLQSSDTVHSRYQNSLITRIPDIMDILSEKPNGQLEVCAVRVATETYCSEIQYLIQLNTGFHFQGTTACLPQLENFSISQMAKKIMETALNLWHLLGVLLDTDPSRRQVAPAESMDVDEDAKIELGDIATATFGNGKGSKEEEDNEEGEETEEQCVIAVSGEEGSDGEEDIEGGENEPDTKEAEKAL